MTKDLNNPFNYFRSELEKVFGVNQKQLNALISTYNKTGYNTPLKKLAEMLGYESDCGLAEVHVFPLCCVSHEYFQSKDIAHALLTKSNLTSKAKKSIRYFFSKLNDKGLRGLEVQYHVCGNLFEFQALDIISDNSTLLEVEDHSYRTICYIPVTRITFGLDDDDTKTISSEFSQHSLAHLISTLQSIYDRNSALAKTYKKSIKDLPVIE